MPKLTLVRGAESVGFAKANEPKLPIWCVLLGFSVDLGGVGNCMTQLIDVGKVVAIELRRFAQETNVYVVLDRGALSQLEPPRNSWRPFGLSQTATVAA